MRGMLKILLDAIEGVATVVEGVAKAVGPVGVDVKLVVTVVVVAALARLAVPLLSVPLASLRLRLSCALLTPLRRESGEPDPDTPTLVVRAV